ncbi:hypothetical protein H8A95_00775 [Bradyrhizobium sp. Pear76]|uniref:hypothetical protein n=1 Tax=Bradyrhizobium oropedii TaxID=1571201 RepID=UPI001E41B193|nr:hypothetical protein [Bradyrhizobium oropedii]MCC8960876.1 hypothetical protein [Bradyrhizobium oropedii]
MRKFVLLFASLVVLIDAPMPACAEQLSGQTVAPASRVKSCSESFSYGTTAEFSERCVALAGPLAAMRGSTLVLRMDSGSRKVFDNKNGYGRSEGGFGYGLADFYPSTRIFVVCDHGPDGGQCTAVEGRTGRQLDFGNAFPQFSPDGNLVLTEESGEDETSFAILDVRGKKQRLVWKSKDSKTSLPAKATFVGWIDDKTIKLESPDKKPVVLTQGSDGTWSVNAAP